MFPYCTYVIIVILFKNVIQDNDSCYKKMHSWQQMSIHFLLQTKNRELEELNLSWLGYKI